MKTLDEVIKAWSICFSDNSRSDCTGCPYADEDGDAACFNHDREDALHYLKEYQTLQYGYIKAMADIEDNPPLTWDDLKGLVSKPVWVEKCQDDEPKGWLLILRTNADVVNCTTKHGNSFYLYRSLYGANWQAYRKERK